MLAQQQNDGLVRLILYVSRSLQEHEKWYGATELEGVASNFGCKTLQALPLWLSL